MSIYISNYLADGFKKVCDVECYTDKTWSYFNIDETLMYSEHRSWVYCIVDNSGSLGGKIVKLGETGNPLGIKNTWNKVAEGEQAQPICGTTSRLGRYRKGGGTDENIRYNLYKEARKYNIGIWAKQCEIIKKQYMVGGQFIDVCITSHKDQELMYLDHIKNTTGSYPWLNVGRK
jgi:hypothetical protein